MSERHAKIFRQNGNKVFFFKRNKNIKKNNEINSYKELKENKFGLFCICYPTALHLRVFKKIYKYGKNFFIEKPLVSREFDLIKLEKIIKKNKKNIFNGFMFRFDPRIRLIKEKIIRIIKEIRGIGLLIGIQLIKDQNKFIQKLMDNNLLTIRAAENVVRVLPPLNVNKKKLTWR